VTPRDPAAELAELQAVFDAVAHPARRQMLLTVHFRGEMSAGQIAGRFAHAWPTTTRHLRVLESAGLLRHEKRGRARVYRVEPRKLSLISEWLGWFAEDAVSARSGQPAPPAPRVRSVPRGRSSR
jgi:DNA-binding transcriptional ArsR family regulator